MPPIHKKQNRSCAATQGACCAHCSPCAQRCGPTPAYLFMADECGMLRVVDPTTNEVVACMQMDCPAGMVIDCDLCKLYVANQQGTTLTVLSSNDLQTLHCIALQDERRSTCSQCMVCSSKLAFNPNNHHVYIPQPGSGTVAAVSGFHRCVVGFASVGGCPVAAAVNTHTNLVYVANLTNEIPVINSNSNCRFSTIALPCSAGVTDLIVNNCDSRIYALRDDGSIAVIGGTTNKLIQTFTPGEGAAAFALDQSIGLLYIINSARNAVLVYDICTLEEIGRLDIPGSACRCFARLAVNTRTHLVYVSDPCANTTYVMDGGLNVPIAKIHTAGQSMEINQCTQHCPVCARK